METMPDLFRKRYLPNELVCLKDDIILKQSDRIIVTQWDTLKPRPDIKRGLSVYFINEGYKISKIYDAEDKLVYWYCDIIHTVYDPASHSYTFHDLLVDVTIDPFGFVKVLDLDEVGDLLVQNKITPQMCCEGLKIADKLLRLIYAGEFDSLKQEIEVFES